MAQAHVKSILPKHNLHQIDDALMRCGGDPIAAISYLTSRKPPDIRENKLGWFRYFDPTEQGLSKEDVARALDMTFGDGLHKTVDFQSSLNNIWENFVPPGIRISGEVFADEEGLGDVIIEYIAPIFLALEELDPCFRPSIPRQRIHDVLVKCSGDKAAAVKGLQLEFPNSRYIPQQTHAAYAQSVYPIPPAVHTVHSAAALPPAPPPSSSKYTAPSHVSTAAIVSYAAPAPPAPVPTYLPSSYVTQPSALSVGSVTHVTPPSASPAAAVSISNVATTPSEFSGYRPPPNIHPPIAAPPMAPVHRRNPHPIRRALLIGINYHGQSGELKGCVCDTAVLRALLVEVYAWPSTPDSIRILTDDPSTPESFQPTKRNIMFGLEWLTANTSPGDALFFSYSGHGSQQEDPHGIEEDGMNETILPVDFRRNGMITDDEISERLVQTLPDGVRLTAVMDSCHSGTGLDLPYSWNAKKNMFEEETNPYHSLGDVVLFSGCEDDSTSCDVQSAFNAPGGAMTTALVGALRHNPHPTYDQLHGELLRQMKKNGFQQRPQMSSSQEFDMGRPFLLFDALPNTNRHIGRTIRNMFRPDKRKRKKKGGHDVGALLSNMIAAVVFGGT